VIRYKCACGKAYQSDESAAGQQVRCRACGVRLVVPDSVEVAAALDRPIKEVPLPRGCPVCDEPFAADQVICTACGYDTVTRRTMRIDLREDSPAAGGASPVVESCPNRPRRLFLWISIGATGLLLMAIVLLSRLTGLSPEEADKRLIRQHVAGQVRSRGYEPGQFRRFGRQTGGYRFEMIVVDAAGLEAGTATGTLRRVEGNGSGSSPTIQSRFDEHSWGQEQAEPSSDTSF